MTPIISISLENEMDLVLSHRKSMKVAEMVGLTLATQTAFATAVSEVARTVIDHTNMGTLQIHIREKSGKYNLTAAIAFDSQGGLSSTDEGFFYAQKLVPEFRFKEDGDKVNIELEMGVPRSAKLTGALIAEIRNHFAKAEPINAYEEIKIRNGILSKVTHEQQETIQQEKIINEKKNEFISIASHEIKTPITVLKAYTQMLQKHRDQCSPLVNDIVNKLEVQTTKLSNLAQQLMDVSKLENGQLEYNLEKVTIGRFLEEVIGMLKYVNDKHQINLAISQPDAQVEIDKMRMEQVLTNLIGNAAKYSEKGTVIQVNCNLTSDGILFSVSDQGMGMSANTLGQVFEKFYRNKKVISTHAGLGMGLYISLKIVVDHGGKIWAESTEGQGSSFYVALPLAS